MFGSHAHDGEWIGLHGSPAAKKKYIHSADKLNSEASVSSETRAASSDDDPVAKQGGWPQWRGRNRDSQAEWLPKEWSEPVRAWSYQLPSQGVGGIVATEDFVVVSSRDINDQLDVFHCLDQETGLRLWEHSYPAPGKLDYGNSPRASSVILDPYVYTLGAFGHLHCISIDTGKVVWQKHLVDDLDGKLPDWGYTGSLLWIDGKLIVQPGGPEQSIVALDAESGERIWSSPGRKSAYASLVPFRRDKQRLLLGFDQISFNGWDLNTGQRMWEIIPPLSSDFNVPTPVLFEDRVTVTSENNGTRLFRLQSGTETPVQEAKTQEMAGDTHSPVRMGRFLAGIDGDLIILDVDHELRVLYRHEEPLLTGYASLISHENRLLLCCESGTVILLAWDGEKLDELGRFDSQSEKVQTLAHPALVGKRLFLRGDKRLDAWDLE